MNKFYRTIYDNSAAVHELTLQHAGTWWQRLSGLIGKPPLPPAQALLLSPCNSVHSAFMRLAIDLVFITKDGKICRTISDFPPWRVAFCFQAWATLELASGEIKRLGLQPGNFIRL